MRLRYEGGSKVMADPTSVFDLGSSDGSDVTKESAR
jgi:hypothetical protein